MYFDKRNKDGLILSFDAFKTGKEISDFSFERLVKSKVYNILIQELCKESIDNYFKTFFYLKSFPYAHRIMLAINENFDNNKQKKFINVKYCKNQFYLVKFLKEKKLNFSKDLILKEEYKKIIKLIISFRRLFNRGIARFKRIIKKENLNQNFKIGVSFKTGIDKNKDSDLYWYDKRQFNKEDLLIYFESNFYKYKFEKLGESVKFDYSEFNAVDLSDFFYDREGTFFKSLINKIKGIKDSKEEIFLAQIALKLIRNVEFWYYFFNKFKVKIHFDSEEMNLNKLEKQISLRILNACTIGRVRSYITKGVYDFMGTNSADVNFVNQKDSADRLLNHSCNISNYVLITGDTNNVFTIKNIDELNLIKKKISFSHKSFVLLILDANFSENSDSDIDQIMTPEYFEKFYNQIIEYTEENDDTFLIIKSKKNFEKPPYIILKNKNIYDKLLKLEKKNRCHIVRDSFRKFPCLYASISNFIICASSALPSSLIDCVARGKKGIFCDYPNLVSIEKDIYKFQDNLIVKDLKNLKGIINKFKLEYPNTKIGDWSLINGMEHAFNDDKGYQRASKFVNTLLGEFKRNLSRNGALKNATDQYEKEFGEQNTFY